MPIADARIGLHGSGSILSARRARCPRRCSAAGVVQTLAEHDGFVLAAVQLHVRVVKVRRDFQADVVDWVNGITVSSK